MHCVPFSIKELNVYAMGKHPWIDDTFWALTAQANSGISDANEAIARDSLRFGAEGMSSFFEDAMQWDVHTLCSELILWMSDNDAQPGSTSLVGILSSIAFELLIFPFVGRDLSMHLRLLVELTATLYSSGGQASYAGRQPSTLWSIHAYFGSKVVQSLDVALSTASLERSSLEQLKALFLVLLATIIAIGYSKEWSPMDQVC